MKNIKEILFPKKVAPVRLIGFRLFNMGGRIRWYIDLIKKIEIYLITVYAKKEEAAERRKG